MEILRNALDRVPVRGALALALGAALLTSCGQTDPPSGEQVGDNAEYFVFNDVTASNGEPVRCVMYGSESEGTQDSKSWFGFACDFEGTAVFPGETTAPTTTELG